jgi:hypothetical protein
MPALPRGWYALAALALVAPACGGSTDSGLNGASAAGSGGATGGGAAAGGAAGAMSTGGATSAGGAIGAGGSSNAAGGALTLPSTCTSDRLCVPFGKLCDPNLHQCVDCISTTDCTKGLECRSGVCVVIFTCTNSLGCASAGGRPICDRATGECVQCVGDADCGDGGSHCVASTCTLTGCAPTTTCAGHCGPTNDGCGKTLDCGPCASSDSWAQCLQDTDYKGGRICSKNIQETLLNAPGRYGTCIQSCTSTAACDPAPAGAEASYCLGGDCILPCDKGPCGTSFECVQTQAGAFCLRGIAP